MTIESDAQLSAAPATGSRGWTLDDIPWDRVDRALIENDERLLYLTAAASFIEITSETYTRNLIDFCAGDREVITWLRTGWEVEEVQHGAALRRYVETVWPAFDWKKAYSSFVEEYGRICTMEGLAKTRALEMVARCVVETGTSSFYRMLADASPEPVLRRLAGLISRDEVDHYKHFYRYFRHYAEREHPSRAAVLRTLLWRTGAADAEDAAIAFKHVRLATATGGAYDPDDYIAFRRSVRGMAARHYRFDMAVKMLLKPLDLGGFGAHFVVPLATAAARRLLFA